MVRKKQFVLSTLWLVIGIFLLSVVIFPYNVNKFMDRLVDPFFHLVSGKNKSRSVLNKYVKKQVLLDEFAYAYPPDVVKRSGKVVEVNITATEGYVEIMDGIKTKVWNYNDTVPGPVVRIKLGDTLRVNFTNNLPDETTIHWHGVRVPNAMDGVPGVTQPPIQPGERFVYEFTPKDAGTYWFHPHVRGSEQLERGLYGVLIVEDEYKEKYNQDLVWVIDDWRLLEDWQIDQRFVTPMDLMHDGRWGNVITVNARLSLKQQVRPGERIRLRFVNASNARVYRLDFGKLRATAIAVDGLYVREPFDADGFELAPGNRLDVDIVIPVDARVGTEYKIYDTFTRYSNQLGALVVRGDPVTTPQFEVPKNPKVPVWADAFDLPIDKEYVLSARMLGMGRIQWLINGRGYPDYEPFTFKAGVFNKIRFVNDSARLHPMHLHGLFFKVISRNGKPVDEGFFRDVVLIYPNEVVDIALIPWDKGNWANHCHIQEHADAGMMTIVKVE